MNNHFIKNVNDPNAVDLHNTFAINVSAATSTVEPKSYLVTLQQTDGNIHGLHLTENELVALGLKTSNKIPDTNMSFDSERFKDPLMGQPDALSERDNQLGSCNNPIQIICNGDTLSTTQNVSASHLKLIADVLLSKQSDGNGVCNAKEGGDEDVVYRVVYPEELNLKPVLNKPKKCGRPKKKATTANGGETIEETEEVAVPAKSARTRSGRIIRPPRHIEKDFKKIDVSDKTENQEVLRTTEFSTPIQNDTEQPKIFESLSSTPKKRIISAKYRCPKCQKVYLGRSRMVKHLEDNPDHGPIPEHCKTNNSEVWNYLVDITQKFPTGKRGMKFCAELSNLLQNLKVLSRYLFKLSDEKNAVALDTFLGAVLDLPSGNYRFNESELHKDVTIFKMLNDMKLFDDANQTKKGDKHENGVNKSNNLSTLTFNEQKSNSENVLPDVNNQTESRTAVFASSKNSASIQDENAMDEYSIIENKNCKSDTTESNQNDNSAAALHGELLSDNSLMNSLPNLRCSVDDLMLPGMDSNVPPVLDTTTSSDEAINVDQFVNERLKTIAGADIDLSNSALSLDLPTMDLFHFHHS